MILAFLPVAVIVAYAASVETASLGPNRGDRPLSAIDAAGNLILVSNSPGCPILDLECPSVTVTKTDSRGKVLFRKNLGTTGQNIRAAHLAVDRNGNILVVAGTSDRQLPTVRPIVTPFPMPTGPSSYTFLWQLAAGDGRILVGTYVSTGGVVSIAVAPAGALIALLYTNDFAAVLAPEATYVLVKIDLREPRIVYGVPLPPNTRWTPLPLAASDDGSAHLLLNRAEGSGGPLVFEVSSDGTRTGLIPLNLPQQAYVQRLEVAPGGGWWIAGEVNGPVLDTTPDAFQREPSDYGYQRWEERQGVTPAGPMRASIVGGLVVDSQDRNRIFATSSRGLLRSLDNGWTWEVVVVPGATVGQLTTIAAGGGRLWLLNASPNAGLLASDDAGSTWHQSSLPDNAPGGLLTAHPSRPDTLYLASADKLYFTRDAGATWTVRIFDFPVRGTAIDPVSPDTILAFGDTISRYEAGISRYALSRDGGDSFSRSIDTPPRSAGFQFDPFGSGDVYFIAAFGIVTRTNIMDLSRTTPLPSLDGISGMAFHPNQPGVLFATSFRGRLLRSMNRGIRWIDESDYLVPRFAYRIVAGEGGVVHLALSPPSSDNFVARISRDGQPSYVTYLGGSRLESLIDFGITPAGQIFVAGQTHSADFPLTAPPVRGDPSNLLSASRYEPDIFLTVFSPTGAISSSTVLGGSRSNFLQLAAPGTNGTFLLFGTTLSADFPGLAPPQSLPGYFLAQLSP